MGWWRLNFDLSTDDTIGDTVADVLDETLDQIVLARTLRGGQKPTLQEVLDVLAFHLAVLSADVYEHHWQECVLSLTATVIRADDVPVSISSNVSADGFDTEISARFAGALKDIAEIYQQDWERLPRLRELLGLFAFTLSEETCQSDQEFSIGEITATTRQRTVLQVLGDYSRKIVEKMCQAFGSSKWKSRRCRPSPLWNIAQARLRQLRLEAQIASEVEEHGFFIMVAMGHEEKPLWAYTIGLRHTDSRLSDVIVIGLPGPQLEGMLRVIADKMLKDGVVFEAGQTYTDLATDGSLCFFGAVVLEHYESYVKQANFYYANQSFPLLQCVWSDGQKCFPWQGGYEKNLQDRQPLLFDPQDYLKD